MSIEPRRPCMPSDLMYDSSGAVPQTRHAKFAPRPVFVPFLIATASEAERVPCRTSNRTVFSAWSTTGSTQTCRPGFVESAHLLESGICAPQARFGHLTVRAHSQAITVSPLGPLGYRGPMRFH